MLIIALNLTPSVALCQIKDLNTQERVDALYKIYEQKKIYKKRLEELTDRYNRDARKCIKDIDSMNQIAIKMGERSEEYVSHNLDLQEGLLSSLKKQEKLEVENATLKAKKKKFFGIGFQLGGTYNFDKSKAEPYFGLGLSVNPIRF